MSGIDGGFNMFHRFSSLIGFFGLVGLVALFAAPRADAQSTYRWEDPSTGRTVYSDHPPPQGTKNPPTVETYKEAPKKTSPQETLPYATRIAAEYYPVKLYTAASCGDACAQGRALLSERRVPFTEIKLDELSEEDFKKTAQQLGSATPTVPLLTVGSQKTIGLNAKAWHDMLDLADYPRTGVTPRAP
ncbi:MAG: DUF4124 domain-containing protein [Candidatus Accumulibacter sp.]|nr:DUF4124 domain-containing protein [Accumulibacter sp.]